MKKQINCMHYIKEAKRTSVYSYALINAELNLCEACEKKLRKEIIEQKKLEEEMIEEIKNLDIKNRNLDSEIFGNKQMKGGTGKTATNN